MSLRAAILAGLAILGIALLGRWLVAPSMFAEARERLDGERLEMMVARAGLWGPVVIVTLMTIAVVASPIPSAPIALAGIVPASFLLAHFGGEAASGDLGRATWAVLGLGLVTGLPVLWVAMRRQPENGTPDDHRK